jgi:Zn-dependent protease
VFRTAWTFAHLRGIPLRLHISLVFILPLISVGIAFDAAPRLLAVLGVVPGALSVPPLVLGGAVAVALFGAVLLHELAHALAAQRQGGRVRAITLMVLGGVTELDHDDATPGQALWVAFAGPLVNLVIGAGALVAAQLPVGLDLHVFLVLLGLTNLFIAVFNLLPAFPLDGGRMVQAALSWKLPEEQATRWAAGIGRVLAVAGGVFAVSRGDLVLALVAMFLFAGAGSELARVRLRASLSGLRARQAMMTRLVSVGPARPVTSVARHMLFHDAQATVVRDHVSTYGVLLPGDLSNPGAEAGDLVDGAPLWAHVEDDLGPLVREMRWQQKPALVRDDFNAVVGVVTLGEVERAAGLRRLADLALAPGGRTVESEEPGT